MQQKQYNIKNLDSHILAISPIEADENSLYILTQQGYLYRYDSAKQHLHMVYPHAMTLPILNHRELRHYGTPVYEMKCSANGKFVAIYVDYGQFGIIIDIEKQCIVLNIDTQNYYEDTVPFSLVFSTFEHDDIVIYRSDWNRLDSFNLTQNISTTKRSIAPYEDERPEHYLDYFHGALYLSPNNEYILDDGWVWQPVSMPSVWSLTDWLKKNPFESEDGPSHKQLCMRDYWGAPVCWLDNQHIAMWLIQLWDEDEFDVKPIPENQAGIHILSINNTMWDDDYTPTYWEMPEQSQKIFNLYVDEDRFIVVGNEQISVYNLSNRALLAQIPNTRPNKQHLKSHRLWSFQDKTLFEVNDI